MVYRRIRKEIFLIFLVLAALLLAGCISSDRLVRISPFSGRGFYSESINLWPLYYEEGEKLSILYPFIDIDDRGFALRPFYHKDGNEHGFLWPLCAFNGYRGWAGPFFWQREGNFGLLPLFTKIDDHLWVFPASWYCKTSRGILPFYFQKDDFLWLGNVMKSKDMFLIFPVFGKGQDWIYFLNFLYQKNGDEKTCFFFPLLFLQNAPEYYQFLSPLFSFTYREKKLEMLNIAMLLYHYSDGAHYAFFPFANVDSRKGKGTCWLWPLFNYRSQNNFPFFLFEYLSDEKKKGKDAVDPGHDKVNIFSPLLFQYDYSRKKRESTVKLLPWGFLWESHLSPESSRYRILGGALWDSENKAGSFDQRILGGLVFLNSKKEDLRHFSLLYKFFAYHKFDRYVKWEFFPFIKITKDPREVRWSFAGKLLEKHEGGGHIFLVPWGRELPE